MKPKILVLDGECNFNIKKILESQFEVDCLKSEIGALDRLSKDSFRFFLIGLKEEGSLEVIKRALEINPDLCIIALSDHPTVEMAVKVIKAGVYDYLPKPIDGNKLKSVLNEAIKDYSLTRSQKEFYQQLAIIDGLTEVYNHRYFHEILSREIERVKRYPQQVSLLMADIDNFKMYNDIHGHQAGDKVLKIVAQNIARQVRQVDFVARYGGEEFAIILPNANRQKAHTLANRIRSSIAQLRIEGEEVFPGGRLTISIGLATYPDEARTKDELIARADKALYKAKAYGRNRIFAFW